MAIFRPYILEIVTWAETFVDDIHKVLCESVEHANVFIWREDSNDSPSGSVWTLHGAVLDVDQDYNIRKVVAANVDAMMKYERQGYRGLNRRA